MAPNGSGVPGTPTAPVSDERINEWERQVLDGIGGTQKSLARYALSRLVDLAIRADERLRMLQEIEGDDRGAEFRFNDTCIALVSTAFVAELADWSEPVQLKCVRGKDGLVEFEMRTVPSGL